MRAEIDMPMVLKTISLKNMLPLLGFCGGSCFYGDTFYKVAAHEGLTVHWPKKNMCCAVSKILRYNYPFMATLLKKRQ